MILLELLLDLLATLDGRIGVLRVALHLAIPAPLDALDARSVHGDVAARDGRSVAEVLRRALGNRLDCHPSVFHAVASGNEDSALLCVCHGNARPMAV